MIEHIAANHTAFTLNQHIPTSIDAIQEDHIEHCDRRDTFAAVESGQFVTHIVHELDAQAAGDRTWQ